MQRLVCVPCSGAPMHSVELAARSAALDDVQAALVAHLCAEGAAIEAVDVWHDVAENVYAPGTREEEASWLAPAPLVRELPNSLVLHVWLVRGKVNVPAAYTVNERLRRWERERLVLGGAHGDAYVALVYEPLGDAGGGRGAVVVPTTPAMVCDAANEPDDEPRANVNAQWRHALAVAWRAHAAAHDASAPAPAPCRAHPEPLAPKHQAAAAPVPAPALEPAPAAAPRARKQGRGGSALRRFEAEVQALIEAPAKRVRRAPVHFA